MIPPEPSLEELRPDPLPLRGRAAVVTGVSRRTGIGYAVARRLAALGASLFVHHYAPHDRDQPWGEDPGGTEAVLAGVRSALAGAGAEVHDMELDLARRRCSGPADPGGCRRLRPAGHPGLQPRSQRRRRPARHAGRRPLDAHWAVNTRSAILLAQAFAAQHDGRPGGRVIFMTSGQDLGPMPGEVAYAASKGALASVTKTLADQLADQQITVNAVNPGPVDTGYATPEAYEAVRRRFPQQRWGVPDDPARLVAWLVTDEAAWITGQVINTEGGFRRWS